MRDGNRTRPGEPSRGARTQNGTAPTVTTAHDDGEPGSVHVMRTEDRTRIVMSGEIDADLSGDLAQAGADAEAAGLPIDIDTHHVTFMDSSGVAFLARLAQRTEHRVRLIHVPPTVQFLLEITQIGDLLDVVEDPET